MTVRELIEKLQALPPDADVYTDSDLVTDVDHGFTTTPGEGLWVWVGNDCA